MKWIDKAEYDFLKDWERQRHLAWEEFIKTTTRPKKKRVTLLYYENWADTGISMSIAYNPKFDGPLKNFKNRKDVKIKYIYLDIKK